MRIVLYAEGGAEDRGAEPEGQPGESLSNRAHGPAHVLAARTIARIASLDRSSIEFVSPLRHRARVPRGSDLHVVKTLHQLLSFPEPASRPSLGIVLVDEDEVADRRRELIDGLRQRQLLMPFVIGMPIREFEAWLLADQKTLAAVLGVTTTPPHPEGMRAGEAKDLLQRWIANRTDGITQTERGASRGSLRRQLAEQADLARLDALRGFQRFRDDLKDALRAIPKN